MGKRKIDTDNKNDNSKMDMLSVANIRKLLNIYIKTTKISEIESLLYPYLQNKKEKKKNKNLNFLKIFTETLSIKIAKNTPCLALINDYPLKTILSNKNCEEILILLGKIYEKFAKDEENVTSSDFYAVCFLSAVLFDEDGIYLKNYGDFFKKFLNTEKLERHLSALIENIFFIGNQKFNYKRFIFVVSEFDSTIDWLQIIAPILTRLFDNKKYLEKKHLTINFDFVENVIEYLETKDCVIPAKNQISFWNEILKHEQHFKSIKSTLRLFCKDDAFVKRQITENKNLMQNLILYGSKELIMTLDNKFKLFNEFNVDFLLKTLEIAMQNNIINGVLFFEETIDVIQYLFSNKLTIKFDEFEKFINILNSYFMLASANTPLSLYYTSEKYEEIFILIFNKLNVFFELFVKDKLLSECLMLQYENQFKKEKSSRQLLFSLYLLSGMNNSSELFYKLFIPFLESISLYFQHDLNSNDISKDRNLFIYDNFFNIISIMLNKSIISNSDKDILQLHHALLAYGFYVLKEYHHNAVFMYEKTINNFRKLLTNIFATFKINTIFFLHSISILLQIYKSRFSASISAHYSLCKFMNDFTKETEFTNFTPDENAMSYFKTMIWEIAGIGHNQIQYEFEQELIEIFKAILACLQPSSMELFVGRIGKINHLNNGNSRCQLVHRFFMENEQYKKFYEPQSNLNIDSNPLQMIASNSQGIHISSVEAGCNEIAEFVIKRYLDDSLKPKDSAIFESNVNKFFEYLTNQASKIFYNQYWLHLAPELENHPNLQAIANFSPEVGKELLSVLLKSFKYAFLNGSYVSNITQFPFNADNIYYHARRCAKLLLTDYSDMVYGPKKLKAPVYLKLMCQVVCDLELFPNQDTLHDRYEIIINTLALAVREYNREFNTPITAEDIPRCAKGLIEDILSCLSSIHPQFKIEVITGVTIKDQFIELYQTKFIELADDLKEQAIEKNTFLTSIFIDQFKHEFQNTMEKYIAKGYIRKEDVEFYLNQSWEVSHFPLIENFIKSQMNNSSRLEFDPNNNNLQISDSKFEQNNTDRENSFKFFTKINSISFRNLHFFNKIKHIIDAGNAEIFSSLEGMIKLTGFDINTTNSEDKTALHLAVIADNVSLVEFLVNNKIDINKLDNMEKTAADYFRADTDKHIIELLRQPIQKISI